MRIVTFNEMVPGMVLYPVTDVNQEREYFSDIIVLFSKTEANSCPFWEDKRAMSYIDMHDTARGPASSNWRTDDQAQWAVVEDQATLDKVRAYVKKSLNETRDNIDVIERFVDTNV